MNYNKFNPTNTEIEKWINNKGINPRTGRKIKINGPTYKIYDFYSNKTINKNDNINKSIVVDNYIDYRNKNLDPILQLELPLDNFKLSNVFKFKYKWNPYTGERMGIDQNGYLSFDPDTLIYYFYNNRLNYLWEKSSDLNYSDYYGDAMGNGPEFNINGRGSHPDWYLFRLPIIDCYLNNGHCHQAVTMGPILSDKEIKEIDRIAKQYKNNYFKRFNRKRPSLFKMKILYDQAINKNPDLGINSDLIPFIETIFLEKMKTDINMKAIKKLIIY